MNAEKFAALLEKLNACQEAREWTAGKDLKTAWKTCERGDWLLWLVGKMSDQPGWPTCKQIVSAACDCAELSLKYVPKGEKRPKEAIRITRSWLRGRATIEQVRKAADAAAYAANAAAYAANAAANAAAAAANAAAYAVNAAAAYAANAAAYAANAANAAAYAVNAAAAYAANAANAAAYAVNAAAYAVNAANAAAYAANAAAYAVNAAAAYAANAAATAAYAAAAVRNKTLKKCASLVRKSIKLNFKKLEK